MSSECSWFIVLQSNPHSPLFSTLFLLPKDQTLKRATKHPRSRLVLLNTSHPDKRLNTKSARLSVILRIAQAPPDSCQTRRPCSVVTLCPGPLSRRWRTLVTTLWPLSRCHWTLAMKLRHTSEIGETKN